MQLPNVSLSMFFELGILFTEFGTRVDRQLSRNFRQLSLNPLRLVLWRNCIADVSKTDTHGALAFAGKLSGSLIT